MAHYRYHELYQAFTWDVPENFNIATACLRHPEQHIALYTEDEHGTTAQYSYGDIAQKANQLSHMLHALGVQQGDRVGVVLPQSLETVVAHMAIYQLGAVCMPLSQLFGEDALTFRLNNSGAKAVIADSHSLHKIQTQSLPALTQRIASDTLWQSLAAYPTVFEPFLTRADDAAVLIYTSGTTGHPKGALIPHRALLGNLSGFYYSQNLFGQPEDVFWSPADWAWTGGLMDALLPTLYYGKPIVGYSGRFDPHKAFDLMQRYRVTHTFLFPTALKIMMKALPEPKKHYHLHLKSIMSAGEAVGQTVFDWTGDALGITINEMFGQTELNYIVGNSHTLWPAKAGSMGLGYPGHQVAVIDEQGNPVAHGEMGEVALHRYDVHGALNPIFFLGYWQEEQLTQQKYSGDWCRTGDLAVQDEEGYLWYKGRADDVFKSSGYRISPSEVESCILKHPAVANVAVIPSPDSERGTVVKAVIVLTPSQQASEELRLSIQQFVKDKLAHYEYPRKIDFVAELPMTTTGKVQRKLLRLKECP